MKAFLFLLLLLPSCSTSVEKMDKGTPSGDHYLWVESGWGGKRTWKNSMGSSYAGDFEKSFADFAQLVVARGASIDYTKQVLAQEVTKRYAAGQITIQMRDKLQSTIALAQTDGELKLGLAKLVKE